MRGSRCQSPKSGVPLSVSRRRNRPASSRRIGRKHPPAATPEARTFHPQATSPNRPSAPASTTPRPAIRRRLSLPAFDHRPQETFRPRDHTPFLFPVGLGLGVVPAHAYVISAAPTFEPAPEPIFRRPPPPKKSVYRSSPRLRCSIHARYSPGKAGSSPSSPSCLTTAATLLR